MAQVTGIDLQDSRLTDYPGTGPITDGLLLVQNPGTRKSHRATASRVGGGGLPPGYVFRDPLAIGDNTAVVNAVLDATNTWQDGDLTAYGSTALQNAGAPAAVANQDPSILVGTADVQIRDEFSAVWPVDGYAYTFRYDRRTDGTDGWCMFRKGRANVLESPDGTQWAVGVNNTGNLITTPL